MGVACLAPLRAWHDATQHNAATRGHKAGTVFDFTIMFNACVSVVGADVAGVGVQKRKTHCKPLF
jgi:hypothetical protein